MPRKKNFIFLLIALVMVLSFGMYIQYGAKTKAAAEAKASRDSSEAKASRDSSEAKASRDSSEAKASRDSFMRNGRSHNANREVMKLMSVSNTLGYLYSDIKSKFEFDTDYCPALKNDFISNLATESSTRIICSRVAYEISEHQTFSVLIKGDGVSSGKRKLIIYNHGHGGLPQNPDYFAKSFLADAIHKGYDILLVSMPFVGIDKATYDFKIKTWDGVGVISKELLNSNSLSLHNFFELVDTGSSHYIRFFIDNAVHAVTYLRTDYDEINYLGLSGGATTGLITCAVLSKIVSNCILVAGVMPMNLRGHQKTFGDAEQISASFYKVNNVFKLIAEATRFSTKLHLLYSSNDECCFSNPYALSFQNQIQKEGLPVSSFFIRESSEHGFDPENVFSILSGKYLNSDN
jgi:hypothetical protein